MRLVKALTLLALAATPTEGFSAATGTFAAMQSRLFSPRSPLFAAKSVGKVHLATHRKLGPIMSSNQLVDLKGKVAFVAGVADASGYGWAIAKQLANAGATIIVGTWPPVLTLFERGLSKGFGEESKLLDGTDMKIEKVYPLDAMFSTPEEVPDEVKSNKRYAGLTGFDIESCVEKVKKDFGRVDILVHSLANGPEVTKPLMKTSRAGYLAASSASAYSMVAMVSKFAPLMPPGGSCISLSYIASERVVPGYGGGMSSAKAQLESDTRVLAWEAGREFSVRVNTISAGPLASRAAIAIKKGASGERNFIDYCIDYNVANAPLAKPLYADDVGRWALALCSPLGSAVTGTVQYVDNGMHAMGLSVDSLSVQEAASIQPRRAEPGSPRQEEILNVAPAPTPTRVEEVPARRTRVEAKPRAPVLSVR